VPGDEPADERQEIAEVPRIERADPGDPRLAELEDGEPSARFQDARDLGERALRFASASTARSRQRRSSPALSTWFRRS
jgi:hypothetical protein